MIDYTAILTRRYSGKEWTLNGDNYDGLTWLSNDKKPTQETLDALWASVQTEIANEATTKITAKQALLDRLGITADEAALLLS
jgi:hypothetical protein